MGTEVAEGDGVSVRTTATGGVGVSPQLTKVHATSNNTTGSRCRVTTLPHQNRPEEIAKDLAGQIVVFTIAGSDDFFHVPPILGQPRGIAR